MGPTSTRLPRPGFDDRIVVSGQLAHCLFVIRNERTDGATAESITEAASGSAVYSKQQPSLAIRRAELRRTSAASKGTFNLRG
ncbi:MAG: hypothetical protein QOH48_1228 [Actinomycetota bacterium]|jgi:hypothetical protein|nr:hypothetical protein [Actinomycetota bacterium]